MEDKKTKNDWWGKTKNTINFGAPKSNDQAKKHFLV